jgi:hypothetical protein
MKTLLGGFNVKIGRAYFFETTTGNENLFEIVNDERVRIVNFATSKI